jgi:hypothetical protein
MAKQISFQTLALLIAILVATSGPIDAQPQAQLTADTASGDVKSASDDVKPASLVELDTTYEAYGFVFEQHDGGAYGAFDAREIAALGQVIEAYAELAGGPETLYALVNGPVRVRRDLQTVVSYTQAGKVIGLGRGAFDLAATAEANYYDWGAESGSELAQIVFGHEIAHRWIDTLRQAGARDWGDAYGENVWRGERPSTGTWAETPEAVGDAEEEAVTNLALYVLDKGYRWTFLHDAPATENRQVWIDGWASDLVAATETCDC